MIKDGTEKEKIIFVKKHGHHHAGIAWLKDENFYSKRQ